MIFADFAQHELKEYPILLRGMTNEKAVAGQQEEVLRDILDRSKETEFGKAHGFSRIHTLEDYRSAVPVTGFDDYRDAIEQMKLAKENILFPGKADSFVVTTGTTGVPKYIPESRTGAMIKQLVQGMRSVELIRMVPEAMAPGKKILAITNSSVYGWTEGGIPCGSASGQAAATGADGTGNKQMVLPSVLLTMEGVDLSIIDYLTIRYAAAQKNTVALVLNNVAHFGMLMDLLQVRFTQIAEEIRIGTISKDILKEIPEKYHEALLQACAPQPERADELEAIRKEKGNISIADLWPEFAAVCCWLSGSVGRSAREYRAMFPKGTKWIEWGYGASEGKFNIPIEPRVSAGLPAVFGYFLEFRPLDGGEIVTLAEAVPEKMYSLIVTSYSGFYRYAIKDIVVLHQTPFGKTIEFLCKESDSLQLGDTTIYANELKDIIERFEDAGGAPIRFYQGHEVNGALQLLIEAVDDTLDREKFESYLRDAFADKHITLNGIEYKENGYRNSLFTKKLASGKSVSSTKLAVFVR